MTWQHDLSPGDLIVLMGSIIDPELNELCMVSKKTHRWAIGEFKRVGAVYNAGHSRLYGSWSFGLPDLHWHPPGTRLGVLGQSPEAFYMESLHGASEDLLGQSLDHECARAAADLSNWVPQVMAEIARRKGQL